MRIKEQETHLTLQEHDDDEQYNENMYVVDLMYVQLGLPVRIDDSYLHEPSIRGIECYKITRSRLEIIFRICDMPVVANLSCCILSECQFHTSNACLWLVCRYIRSWPALSLITGNLPPIEAGRINL